VIARIDGRGGPAGSKLGQYLAACYFQNGAANRRFLDVGEFARCPAEITVIGATLGKDELLDAIFRIDAEQALARIVRPLGQRQIANKVTAIAELRRLGGGALALQIEPQRISTRTS